MGPETGGGKLQLEALRAFKTSLAPPPSRGWIVGAVIAAIVISQALLNAAFEVLGGGDDAERLKAAVAALSLSPDAQPVGDFLGSLLSADAIELGVVISVCASIVYLFGRPLAGGYRLAQLCVGRRAPRARRQRDSELCTKAASLSLPAHERLVARALNADLRAELPLDLVIKAAPVIALMYAAALFTRPDLAVQLSDARWIGALVIAAGAWRLAWIERRTEHRATAGMWIGVAVLLVVALVFPAGRAEVPQLVGLESAFVAEKRLREEQLRVGRVTRRISTAPVGSVIDQSPGTGVVSEPGDVVRIVVAVPEGDRKVSVPLLRGLTAAAADERLRGFDLVLGELLPSSAAATWVVRDQIPAPDVSVNSGSRVRVFMSKR